MPVPVSYGVGMTKYQAKPNLGYLRPPAPNGTGCVPFGLLFALAVAGGAILAVFH